MSNEYVQTVVLPQRYVDDAIHAEAQKRTALAQSVATQGAELASLESRLRQIRADTEGAFAVVQILRTECADHSARMSAWTAGIEDDLARMRESIKRDLMVLYVAIAVLAIVVWLS